MSPFQRIRTKLANAARARRELARLEAFGRAMPRGIEIVFYAESKNDWIYFEGLIRELVERRERSIVYLTSSRDDPVLSESHANLNAFYVGEGFARTFLFRSIDCKVFVMTLTDLDQLHLARSVHDVHYVYLFHAIVSAHMVYRERSFNAYDTFFTVGPHHDREIAALRRFYGMPSARLVPFGYHRLERLLEENASSESSDEPSERPNVLIAPSWGEHSITRTVARPLIDQLLKNDLRVTFRPHPMSLRKDRDVLAGLQRTFGASAEVAFDLDIRDPSSLRNADVMISDWSGAALEFALGFGRPVLFIDTEPKIHNADFDRFMSAQDEPIEPIERALRTTLGEIVPPSRLDRVGPTIRSLLDDRRRIRERSMACRNHSIYNLGTSSSVGADHLIELVDVP